MQMMASDDWRTPTFRQNMISKIEEAIQQCGASMNGSDLESQIFTKAKHKEEYMSLVTRIIMHIKDKGSKKHGVGAGNMGQPNQAQGQGPGGQMGGQMAGGQGTMMMNQMNPMTPMHQMGVNVMNQQGMVHQMQQPQLVQQMQSGMNQGQHSAAVMGGLSQQQPNQQAQQQHQMSQQGQNQMMSQNQMALGMNQGQIQIPQMQQIQNGQMGNPQMQQQLQMQNAQMQQALLQGNSQQIMMQGNQQVMMQGNQPQQTMIGGQPQMMMQGNGPQQQNMMQQSQAQQGVMSGAPQQQQAMMQAGSQQQQQQQGMMSGQPQQPQPGNQQQQMIQVRGLPNSQMVGNRLMSPQPNVSANALTALAHAQQQRKAQAQQQQQQPRSIPNAMGIPRPEHGTNYTMNTMNRLYYGSNMAQVENVPVNVQFQGGPGAQMQQRPVGPFVQSNSSQGMPSPSPGGISSGGQMPQQQQQQSTFVNSPGSQTMMHRPSGPISNSLSPFPNQIINVPSPNTNLNTPMPMAPTPSPRNAEDQACFEKIKELKRYTDLLQRMIAKIGNEDVEKSSKMKKLLEILTNPNQRVSMEILLKCEVALKKMERQQHDTGGVLGPSSTSVPTPQPKDQTSPFQQIQDAILASTKSGAASHTFLRTFRQSVEALTGQPFATSSDPYAEQDQYFENELALDVPGILRRELKIIDNRFKIKVIRNPRSPMSLVLHASLTEPRLPRVPPLKIYIPLLYPEESPSIIDLRSEYGSTGFLNSVARTLKSRLLHLPQRFTVLELLGCWEMSVRQVCNPHYKATAIVRKRLSSSLASALL